MPFVLVSHSHVQRLYSVTHFLLGTFVVFGVSVIVWVCNVRHKFKSGFSVGRAGGRDTKFGLLGFSWVFGFFGS